MWAEVGEADTADRAVGVAAGGTGRGQEAKVSEPTPTTRPSPHTSSPVPKLSEGAAEVGRATSRRLQSASLILRIAKANIPHNILKVDKTLLDNLSSA